MNNQNYIAAGQQVLMNTYARQPLAIVKGQGCQVWDGDGKQYLDFVAGIAVNSVGHCHPKVVAAIQKQAETLLHCSNLYWIPGQAQVGEILVKATGLDRIFFCNSGAEANEGALKLARKYAKEKGHPERFAVITMEKSFHGRTLATLTATGQVKVQKGYEPLPNGFCYVPYNTMEAIAAAVNETTCAVLLEPVQGEGGVIVPDTAYMQELAAFCKEKDILLILDEVQTGIGRTGKLFAYEHFGICPDILTMAKALGGGAPTGAFMAREEVASVFVPGDHGSTFGGNPLLMAAAKATLETILTEDLSGRAAQTGQYLMAGLKKLQERFPFIKEVRGLGLLIGIECTGAVAPVITACREAGLLIAGAGPNVLRMVPPLIIGETEVDAALAILSDVFAAAEQMHSQAPPGK